MCGCNEGVVWMQVCALAGERYEQLELAQELVVHIPGRRRADMVDHNHGSAALQLLGCSPGCGR